MSSVASVDIDVLLAPISGASPSGESLRYSPSYDAIQHARRSDDPGLNQGDWQRELKIANWREVTNLIADALATKSKDLQLGIWLVEALIRQFGFPGLRDGLRLLRELLEKYWDTLHPVPEDGDLEDRIGPLEWLNDKLPPAVRSVELTGPDGAGKAYSWLAWQESRTVEELGRKDSQLKEAAIAEGKIAGEQFDKAVVVTGKEFYLAIWTDLGECVEEHQRLVAIVDQRFGKDAPNLRDIRIALQDCHELLEQIIKKKGGFDQPSIAPSSNGPIINGGASAIATINGPSGPAVSTRAPTMVSTLSAEPTDRAEALNRLEAIADFFRRTEPHSPVALLVQRAVRWGQMPLEEWLKEVIHDQSVLVQLNETLGIKVPEQKD
jgi:type VI secretion system protein ImpA